MYWRDAGITGLAVTSLSLGGGIVMSGTKGGVAAGPRREERVSATPPFGGAAFYALRPGGWRDYWTLLHPPYTAWHLSYVLLGAALAPSPDPRVVGSALLAFFLAVGIAAHSFDELQGRPLGTRIPSRVLVALGACGLAGALALGIAAATVVGPGYLVFVVAGAALVLLYAFEVPLVHSDLGFALAWGGFPVLATAFAAALVSLAQRRLSTPVRRIRRKGVAFHGEIRYRDGSRETLTAPTLIAAPEAALRLLWLAMLALGVGALVARWSGG